jgi:hypothetical protein
MKTLNVDGLVGKRIQAARPLNYAELRYEDAVAGVILDLGMAGAIVIVQKTLDSEEFPSDECWTEARWMKMDGSDVDLTA